MYKATRCYEDQSSSSNTLSFNAGDMFYIIDKTNSSWWFASKDSGETGYILCNYIEPIEKVDTKDVVLQSIDRAIAAIYASSPSSSLPTGQQAVLRKLNQHKQDVLSSNTKKETNRRPAPPPPARKSNSSVSSMPQRSSSTKRQAPQHPSMVDTTSSSPAAPDVTPSPLQTTVNDANDSDVPVETSLNFKVPVQLGQDLMNKIQTNCPLPDAKSKEVVKSLLSVIGENVPQLTNVMQEIVDTLPEVEATGNPDLEKLRLALANITEIKEDGQQNSWAIEDDEIKISGILNEIMEALVVVDKAESVSELSYNDYEYLVVLAVYHQIESRTSLRLLCLQIFGIICSLSNSCISALMSTVLPLELVQDITVHTDEIERVCYSALVFSMLFSTGEPIPLNYYDRINEKFITFLINSIENGVDGDAEDRVPDIFVRLILSINLHLVVPTDNFVMESIGECTCTTLSEKIMLLVNRGDDPVKLKESDETPSSVLKFLQDIFSRQDTSLSFLYTNDLFVLIDIIIRNLSDLPSGVKTRTDYLDLLLNVLEHSSYHESKHRPSEVISIIERIEEEELPMEDETFRSVAEFDKTIAKKILCDHKPWLLDP